MPPPKRIPSPHRKSASLDSRNDKAALFKRLQEALGSRAARASKAGGEVAPADALGGQQTGPTGGQALEQPEGVAVLTVPPTEVATNVATAPSDSQAALSPYRGVRSGMARVRFLHRQDCNTPLAAQPWTHGLVDSLLEAADAGGMFVCLVWPARLPSLAPLHALMNLERHFARDLRGVRTLFYPGNGSVRSALDAALIEREGLAQLARDIWRQVGRETKPDTHTRSVSFEALIAAINNLVNQSVDAEDPSLAEIGTAFFFDANSGAWRTAVHSPLERTLARVPRLMQRQLLREEVGLEWQDSLRAPGALMVMRPDVPRLDWPKALENKCLRGDGAPALLLLDATVGAQRRAYAAVEGIPAFLTAARKAGHTDAGAVLVTDDPRMFFVLRKQLADASLACQSRVWAAEADPGQELLSPAPCPAAWRPPERSRAFTRVSIVDRHASALAATFQSLAKVAGEGTPHFDPFMAASQFVLRLSNMPAGYRDLDVPGPDGLSYAARQHAWTPLYLAMERALDAKALSQHMERARRALARGQELVEHWAEATPMAERLLSQVTEHLDKEKTPLCLVLPNQGYVGLAQRFLARRLGDGWAPARPRLDWLTLSTLEGRLAHAQVDSGFVFVGMNREVLRLLLAHPRLPHGAWLFLPYQRAESTLRTLQAMDTLEAFKPFRGRLSLLKTELERRLKEVPNAVNLERLRRLNFDVNFELNPATQADEEEHDGVPAWRFILEGGQQVSAGGVVWRHEPNEEPPIRRTAAANIAVGDVIFEMSAALREKVEDALGLRAENGRVQSPGERLLLRYRKDLDRRCETFFAEAKEQGLSALTRAVHQKMTEIGPEQAGRCSLSRVRYWLDVHHNEQAPHGSNDAKDYALFCKALRMDDERTNQNLAVLRGTRIANQAAGRELMRQYAEIMFQPESAIVYQELPAETVRALSQEALQCLYRVDAVIAPAPSPTL